MDVVFHDVDVSFLVCGCFAADDTAEIFLIWLNDPEVAQSCHHIFRVLMGLVPEDNTSEVAALDDVFGVVQLKHQGVECICSLDGAKACLDRSWRKAKARD